MENIVMVNYKLHVVPVEDQMEIPENAIIVGSLPIHPMNTISYLTPIISKEK